MKVPSEAELIEIENRMARIINRAEFLMRRADPYSDWPEIIDRFKDDFRLLIALARDPSQLLQTIPGDDLIDRSLDRFGPPPRTAKPEPVPSLAPKQKKKSC